MLLRSRADHSIIACVSRHGQTGMKLTWSDTPFPGESPPGTLFRYTDRYWAPANNDREAYEAWARIVRSREFTHIPPAID
jgi:hypothetical protein